MATTIINTTGAIPEQHLFDALFGLWDDGDPSYSVRVEWPHRGGWVQFDSIERVRLSITGDIHVTATVTAVPTLGNLYKVGDRFTGWISPGRGDEVSIWQTIEVNASNFESVF